MPVFWGTLLGLGEIVKGTFLIAAGVIVIGLVDNVLRPILVGRETRVPDYLVLLSTLGGISVFGVSGFVIGPVIAAFFLVVWEMFAQEHAEPTAIHGERPAAGLPKESNAPLDLRRLTG